MSTASNDDLGTMTEAKSDTEESTSRTDHDHDETTIGGEGDEESTYVGGGDLLREILRDLSVSFDTTKSGSNSNSQVSGGSNGKSSGGNGDAEEEEEESSSASTLSNDEYDDVEISEEERLQNEKELVAGLLTNAMRAGKEPDVIRPPHFKKKKVAFAKKKTVRSTELVAVAPEAKVTPEAAAVQEEEAAAKQKSTGGTPASTAIVPATATPTKAFSSSYLASILNLWRCADENNVEDELQQQQMPLELPAALASLGSCSSDMAPSDQAKTDKTAMVQSSDSMQSAPDDTADTVNKKDAEKHMVLTALRKRDTIHKEKIRDDRSRGGGLNKTYSMPVDFHDDELDSIIRAVRSHEVMLGQYSVEETTKAAVAAGGEESPPHEEVGDVTTETSVHDIAVTDQDAVIDKAEGVEKYEERGSGKFRRFSRSASNHMIDTVRSSTSWVKSAKSSDNLRQVKSLDYEMNHNSILLPENQDFVISGLPAQKIDGENVSTNLGDEVDQLDMEKGDGTEQTETFSLTPKESKSAPKSTMGRLKKKIKGLAIGKKGAPKEPSSLIFSAGQQQVQQRKPRRSKHNIFRSLAKYVKSQPLDLAVIEENSELETREEHEEPVPPVLSARDETLTQASSKVINTVTEVKIGKVNDRNTTNMTETVAAIVDTISQNTAEQISETRSHPSSEQFVADDAQLRNTSSTSDPEISSEDESMTNSEDESKTNTDTDSSFSDDWASTDDAHTCSTSKESVGSREAHDDGAGYRDGEIRDDSRAEMGTEIELMPKGYSTNIEVVGSRGDLVLAVDIDAFNELISEEENEHVIHEKEYRSHRSPREREGSRNGKKSSFRIKGLLSDFKKKTTGKSGVTAAASVAANANIQVSKVTAKVNSPVKISQPALSAESIAEVDPGSLQMRSWIENEHQKGFRFTSLMASPSSPRSFTAGADSSIQKQKTWTGMSPELSLLLAAVKKTESMAIESLEAPSTRQYLRSEATTEEVRDDMPDPKVSARDEERTGPVTEPETEKTNPHGRRFFSRMLSKSSLMTNDRHDNSVPECLEHTLTSYDVGYPQSSTPSLHDVPIESLRTVIDLQRWKSVEQKIDASLKKAEALASHYGGDLADTIHASASYSSYASSSVALSPATSYASEMVSVAESKPDDWRQVGRKIDDSISKVEKLAFRLGLDEKRGKLHSE